MPDLVPAAYLLRPTLDPGGGWRRLAGAQPAQQLTALGAAVVNQERWSALGRAVLVVRTEPEPLLAVLGFLRADAPASLRTLAWQVEHVLPTLRYVDYHQAERDCERLADELTEVHGADALRAARWVALPRGGQIVLGMLAYALDLDLARPATGGDQPALTVVVDDCALSGARFGRFLATLDAGRVVFATLYSHPGLRTAITAVEPRVVGCGSAHDLVDHAPARLGGDYPAWSARWRDRGDDYWTGQPEHVCFAWNEPDTAVWDPEKQRTVRGWRLLPPAACLKNRHTGAVPGEVQVQHDGPGPIRSAPATVWGHLDGKVLVAGTSTGRVVALDGVAADMWQAVTAAGTVDAAVSRLVARYDTDEPTLRADLTAFLRGLAGEGLLTGLDS
ncbi:MAG: PqqD family protein [Egibacteraceae bacterium]